MFNRLWIKLSASFLLVIILFAGGIAVSARYTLEQEFAEYAQVSDLQLSQQIAGLLSDELSFSYHDSDDEISEERFFSLLQEQQPASMQHGRHHMRGESPASGLPMFHSMLHREQDPMQDIVVTDTRGQIQLHHGSGLQTSDISALSPERGAPVDADGETVAYVFAGTMIDPSLDQYRSAVLVSMNRWIIITALAAAVLAAAVSVLLFRHIVAPVGDLSRASKQIAGGTYEVKVPTRRRDELGELSESFNAMVESLHRSDLWKRRVITDAAHELRTPVSLLAAEIEMLLEGVYPADREHLSAMEAEVRQLSRLIEELQELSAAEAGTMVIRKEEFRVCQLADRGISAFTALAEGRHITFTRQQAAAPGALPADASAVIFCDEKKITQVLSNLLANALRHTPRGGSVDVSCSISRQGELIISVEDSGPGISPEHRNEIFERFYRIDGHRGREAGGAGLGLSISREIMRLHQGIIRAADPCLLGGARVEMVFPGVENHRF